MVLISRGSYRIPNTSIKDITMDGQTDYFNRYSEQLTGVLLQGCVREGYGTKKLLQVEELEDKWQSMAIY